jgi:4-methyl-5(b-hydroxyethyl)-thiazole monophosphate biosynthesis
MSKTVLVPIADGTEELEAVTIIDVLRRAGATVTVASVDGPQVTASRGTKLAADRLIRDCKGTTFDLIALPGGMPGSEHLRDSADLTNLLKQQAREGRLYAAICAAPVVVLQHHGLLGDRRATCHSSLAARLDNRQAVDQSVVVDGTCITSRGPRTALEFALKLVEALYGEAKARQVDGAMV